MAYLRKRMFTCKAQSQQQGERDDMHFRFFDVQVGRLMINSHKKYRSIINTMMIYWDSANSRRLIDKSDNLVYQALTARMVLFWFLQRYHLIMSFRFQLTVGHAPINAFAAPILPKNARNIWLFCRVWLFEDEKWVLTTAGNWLDSDQLWGREKTIFHSPLCSQTCTPRWYVTQTHSRRHAGRKAHFVRRVCFALSCRSVLLLDMLALYIYRLEKMCHASWNVVVLVICLNCSLLFGLKQCKNKMEAWLQTVLGDAIHILNHRRGWLRPHTTNNYLQTVLCFWISSRSPACKEKHDNDIYFIPRMKE